MAFSLEVDIEARFAKFEESLNQTFKTVRKTADSLGSAFDGVRHALEAIGIGLSLHEIARLFSEATKEAEAFEQSTAKISAVLHNIGVSAGITQKEIAELGESLS